MDTKTWDVLDAYFKSDRNFLSKHHLDSFNDFVYTKIPNTIKSLNPFVTLKNDRATGLLKHKIEIFIGGKNGDELFLQKPHLDGKLLVPNEARLKNQTYKSDLLCNVLINYDTYDETENLIIDQCKSVIMKDVKIGTIPIMLHSKLCVLHDQPNAVLKEMGECIYDQGGYLIIDGKEKVIIAQERIGTNRLFLNRSKDKDYTFEGMIRCTTEEAAIFPKTLNIAVYSDQYLKGTRKNSIVMTLPNVKREIPIFILFRAMGIESDKHILEHILYNLNDPSNSKIQEFAWYSMRDGAFLYTQEEALEFLSHHVEYKNVDHVKYVLMNDLFPNMNEGSGKATKISLHKKALFLGHVISHTIKTCLGLEKESDRDNYAVKRVDLSGFLMANLFRDFYNLFRNECRSAVDRKYNYNYGHWNKSTDLSLFITNANRYEIFDSNILENGMIKSLKGKWGIKPDPAKAGIVQDLSRISYIGYLSHLRRVNTPVDRTIKIVAPHRLHPTQWGSMCPCESPDGASIGLLKNFALLCHVSFDCSSKEIRKCLKDLNGHDLKVRFLDYIVPGDFSGDVAKVLINSNWVGLTSSPDVLVKRLRLLRRNALINVMTSVSWNIVTREININTEAGRCCRPIYIVENNKLLIQKHRNEYIKKLNKGLLKWEDLIKGSLPGNNSYDVTDCKYYDPFQQKEFADKDRNDKLHVAEVWQRLHQTQSVVEFIDVEESNTCMIAMQFKDLVATWESHLDDDKGKHEPERIPVQTRYTHCEIHPSTMFAVLTANIPFADHNQAPRNYFSGQQGKQSISVYNTAFVSRMDTTALVLHYSQRRMVNTRYMHYLGNNALPHGTNTIVAIMTYTGLTLC